MRTILPRSAIPVVAALMALASGCFGSTSRSADPVSDEARAQRSALMVLDGRALAAAVESGATLPQILSTRVTSLREVRSGGPGNNCPVFVLRGNSSLQQITEPDYYVDGSRANDSCVLLTLAAREVRAIEVYASGAAPAGMPMRARTGGAIVLRTRIR